MPVSRLTAEGLADQLAAHYADAEVRLLRQIARHMEAGTDAPEWVTAKLAELQLFRGRARRLVERATEQAMGMAATAAQTAYIRGTAAGQGDVDRAGIKRDLPEPALAERAVLALVESLQGTLADTGLRVVRNAEDAYRDVVARASTGTLTGSTTRLQDAQQALDGLARRGVSAFTDTAGRRWGLQSYVEMATRTTTAQAAVAGHMDRLEQAGLSLFIVSDSSRECELCRPWEGKVLSRGPVSAMQRNAVTGAMESVQVDGTVEEATGAGLFHPNCTHNLSAYIHGATRKGDATGNADGYAEKQRQRQMERSVREWKRREAVAITPEAQRLAKSKVREWQGALSAHTKATGLPRKRNRESLTAAR